MKFKFLILGVLIDNTAFATNIQQKDLERELVRDLDAVLPEQSNIQIPNIGSAQYGALANNETRLLLKQFIPIYSAPPPAEIAGLVAGFFANYNGQNLTLKQIVALTRTLEQQLVQYGFPLVRIVIPAQNFKANGADIKINIVSGYIENIRVDFGENDTISAADKQKITTFINNAWGDLKAQKYLQKSQLNSSLLTLRSQYGITPKLFISTGRKLGGFNLNVTVTHTPNTHFVSLKNNLGAAFGNYAGQYVGMFNNIKDTHTEQYRIISVFSLEQREHVFYRMVKLDYKRKLINGNTYGGYMTANRTASVSDAKDYSRGISAGYGVSFTTPMVTQFNKNARLKLALDSNEDASMNVNNDRFQYYYHKDRITMMSLSFMYDVTRANIKHDVTLTIKRHVPIFRSRIREQDNIRTSKANITARHAILEVGYGYIKSYKNVRHHITLNAQATDKQSVLSTHRFSFMGSDKVAGFVGNGMSADSGLSINTGLTFKTIQIGKRGISPTLDFAYASGRVYNASAVENANPRANSIKLGFSTNFGNTKWQFGISHARKQTQKQWETDEHYSINVLRLF